MKKPSRIAVIVGLLLILAGFAWSGFSGQRIIDDVHAISSKDFTTKTADFDSAPIQNIKTNLDNLRVVVDTNTATNKVTVDYFETEEDKLAVTNTNGTLQISRSIEKGADYLCFFRCISAPHKITIHVPADSSYAYDVTANNGPVAFEPTDALLTKSIRIESSNSSVQLQNVVSSSTIDLRNNNGSIKLRDTKAGSRLTLESSNARTDLNRVEAPIIKANADNGSMALEYVTSKDLTATASNALITLTNLATEHATITNDNGSIAGTAVGTKDDYDTRITNDNGSIQIDGDWYSNSYFSDGSNRSKSLTIRGSNASVKVNFIR